MVFYIIGLGLSDEKDITIKGFEAIQLCSEIYLEAYTSILGIDRLKLESFYKKSIIEADRETCEETIDQILSSLSEKTKSNPSFNAAFLVVGDPFCATTHTDLFLRAVKAGLDVKVIHNASIMNAVGSCGMQVYRFGEAVSIPFFTEKWRPYSFYEKIKKNLDSGLHTLVLLDIKVKERSEENLLRNKKIYEPARFMTVQVAAQQILEAEEVLKLNGVNLKTKCMGLARIGQQDQKIVGATLEEFLNLDLGSPLHSMVICADKLHTIEEEMFEFYLKKP